MSQKYHGTIEELMHLVKSTGFQGEWQSVGTGKSEKQTFRTPAGGILNLWPNGTINFQGNDFAKGALERTLQVLLSGSSNSEPSSTSNAEPYGATKNATISVAANQPQSRLRNSCDAPSLLKRVKATLANSGLRVMLVNDSTYVVRELEYDHFCSLVQQGSEIFIREMQWGEKKGGETDAL